MGYNITVDIKEFQIFQYGLLEFRLVLFDERSAKKSQSTAEKHQTNSLLRWIRVIKANDQLALVHFREILVQHSSFCVPDV